MQQEKRILFVDDEPNVLAGLRRMLRQLRKEWDMIFVGGAQEALAILATMPVDVIVSDMRMPGMNGAELLSRVKQMYPQIARIALSGQTSKESILRSSVGPIHQYLAKPCDAETLMDTIRRVCLLRNILQNDKLQGLISDLESLPCLSSHYTELMKELQSEDASIRNVGRVISQDVAMSAKILQLINSSFFGVRESVSSISQAVALLGLDIIKSLVLSIKVFSKFDSSVSAGFSITKLWEHCIAVGDGAKWIAQRENTNQRFADYAMLAGMLHDVGKLVLAAKMPQEYERILQKVAQDHSALCEAEREFLNITHAEVGAYLLGLWGVSHDIIEALLYHHCPTEAKTGQFSILTAVYLANLLTRRGYPPDNTHELDSPVDMAYLTKIQMAERFDCLCYAYRTRDKAVC